MDFAFCFLHSFRARHMEDYNGRKLKTPTKKKKRFPAENDPTTTNE